MAKTCQQITFIIIYYILLSFITIFGAINITKDPWSSCLGYHRRFQVWLEVGLRIWKAADHAGLPRARPAKHDLPLLDDCRGLYFYYPKYWWFMANGPWWKTHENQATMEWQRILYCLNKNYSISKSQSLMPVCSGPVFPIVLLLPFIPSWDDVVMLVSLGFAGVGSLPPEDVHCDFGVDWFDLKAAGLWSAG